MIVLNVDKPHPNRMHRILAALILSALTALGADVVFPFQNVQGQGQAVREVSLFPVAVRASGAYGLVVQDKVTKPTGLAGSVTFSNLLDGGYRVEFKGSTLTSTQYFQFPDTNGLINATNYVIGTNPPALTTSYADVSGGSTNYAAQSNLVQAVIGRSNYFGGLRIYQPYAGAARIGGGTNNWLFNWTDQSYGASASFPGMLYVGNLSVLGSIGGTPAANVETATAIALSATNAANANSVVQRDANGNFAANNIAASSISSPIVNGSLDRLHNGYQSVSFGGSPRSGNLRMGGVVKSTVVSNGMYNAFPGLTVLPNGDLFCVYRSGSYHLSTNGTTCYQISTDAGKTWGVSNYLFKPAPIGGFEIDERDCSAITTRAGKVLVTCFQWNGRYATGVYSFLGTPTNGNVSWVGPTLVPTTFAQDNATCGPAIELPNGDLILPVYGMYSGGYDSMAIVRSTDGGTTWGSQVTLATGSASADYSEATGTLLADGSIVMFIRQDIPTPGMWRTVSMDNGHTWSTPSKVLSVYAARPTVCRLKSGGLCWCARGASSARCDYRTSWDYGLTWTDPLPLIPGTSDSDYSAMVLLSGGEIGMVCATEDALGGQAAIYYWTFEDGAGAFSGRVVTPGLMANQVTVTNTQTILGSLGIGEDPSVNNLQVYKNYIPQATFHGYSALGPDVNTGSGSILIGDQPLFQGILDYNQNNSTTLTVRNSYTNSAARINLEVGSARAVTVLGNGGVGINNTNPAVTLDVGGDVHSSQTMSANYVTVTNNITASNNVLVLGKAGIGTASPSNSLQVLNSSAPQALFHGYSALAAAANMANGTILIGNTPSDQGILDYDWSANTMLTLKNSYTNSAAGINLDVGSNHVMRALGSGAVTVSGSLTVGGGLNTSNLTVSGAVSVAGVGTLTNGLQLISPTGGVFTITIGNDGTLTTTRIH